MSYARLWKQRLDHRRVLGQMVHGFVLYKDGSIVNLCANMTNGHDKSKIAEIRVPSFASLKLLGHQMDWCCLCQIVELIILLESK